MDATHAYVARRTCGCAVALFVYVPCVADDIAGCIRDGLTLTRVTIPEARATPLGCVHTTPTKGA